MDDSEFHRLKRLPPYVFAEVNAMKARGRAAPQLAKGGEGDGL